MIVSGQQTIRFGFDRPTMPKISHAGVLPYRITAGEARYLLITSRGSKRWIIPKGRREDGRDARETALVEGYEEAGLKGEIGRRPLGAFRDRPKTGPDSMVLVYPFHVLRRARTWPEKAEREAKWFKAEDAIAHVDYELGELIKAMNSRLRRAGKTVS
jgi:8-oxo-dGTP pyrophosphatase MutT (NUDIX family)